MSTEKTENLENFINFSARLAQILDKRPQTYTAKRLRVSQHTISKWLKGDVPRQFRALYWLAKEFDVDLHWLITGQHLGSDINDPRVKHELEKLRIMARLHMVL